MPEDYLDNINAKWRTVFRFKKLNENFHWRYLLMLNNTRNNRFINYYINFLCNHFNRICFIILNGVDNMMDKILIINKFRYIAWCKVTAQLKKSIILASACTQRKNILCACQLILPQSSNESRINPLTQY